MLKLITGIRYFNLDMDMKCKIKNPHISCVLTCNSLLVFLQVQLTELLAKNGAVTEKARWQILVSVLLGFHLAQN